MFNQHGPKSMRELRQHKISAVQITYSPTPQLTSSSSWSLGKLWDEWQIQCIILVSFGLQVFLFLASDMRRRSASRILRLIMWLAYLSADSVAIFVLGHLALHANGPQHQLLFFWAPFVLLHLGGQDTITAFSIQDNELWTRHLLGLVTQVAAAGYVVSRTCWPDRQLRTAMVLMFLSGCFKYVERTICLYRASSTRLMEFSLLSWDKYAAEMIQGGQRVQGILTERFKIFVKANERRHSYRRFHPYSSATAISLVSDTPLNDPITINALHQDTEILLQGLKSNKNKSLVYDYVSIRPVLLYERLYTKAPLRFWYMRGLDITNIFIRRSSSTCLLILLCLLLLLRVLHSAFLLFFPFVSTSATLVLFFKIVGKDQLYSRADVIVSYILLIGALIMEVASVCITILSYVQRTSIFRSGTKLWSEMLGQYNMTESLTRKDTICIMTFVPHWIRRHLDESKSRIPISEELNKFVLDKLCDFGTREQDWNFASFHGKLSLGKWMETHKESVPTRAETPLNSSIIDLDLPTSVLILHIATDILYFHDNKGAINFEQQKMKKISRELSNYIMYLVFKCGVMLTSRSKLLHDKAQKEMQEIVNKDVNLGEKEAITKAFQANRGHRSLCEEVAQMLLLKDTFTALTTSVLSRASDVGHELIDIHRKVDCWDLVAAVWVEILYYISPRCGATFHSHHLSTGGEFTTHVLTLMQLLGPFIPPPST